MANVIAELSDTSRCIAADLPAHGASPARDDMSPAALAEALADLCDGLGLGQVDLVGNDTGGAIAQIFAARHPDKIRTLTLTNCDCEGNFPPADFAPIIEQARQGALAPLLGELAENPQTWPTHPLSMGYQYPDRVPRTPGGTTSSARPGPSSAPATASDCSPRSTRPTSRPSATNCGRSRRRPCWSGVPRIRISPSSGRTTCAT